MKVAATTANKQNQSRAVANNVSNQKNNSRCDSGLVDNRPETMALKSLQMMINDSPRMVAQRQRTSNITGDTAQVIKGPDTKDTNVPNGPAGSSKFIRLYAPSQISKFTQSHAPSPVSVSGTQEFGFVDNRPEVITQRKLQEMSIRSQVAQLSFFQEMANNSPLNENDAQLQVMADNHQQPLLQKKSNNVFSYPIVQLMDSEQDSDSEHSSEYEEEEEEEDNKVPARDPGVITALEILNNNNNGISEFVAREMHLQDDTVDDRLVSAIQNGITNWGTAQGKQSFGFGGQTSIVLGGVTVATNDGENWKIEPEYNTTLKNIIYGAMWSGLKDHFQEEVKGDEDTMGLLGDTKVVKGVTLLFTKRVDSSSQAKVINKVIELYSEVVGTNTSMLAEQVFRNQKILKAQALNVWKTTTGADTSDKDMLDTKKSLFKINTSRSKLHDFLRMAQFGLINVFKSGKIKLVIDRAKNKQAFGGASPANDTTPEHMIKGEISDQLVNDQMIRVNLDATGLAGFKTTMIHELAHVAGFNPSGMQGSGHMAQVESYLEEEDAVNLPKIMVDAYFMETVYNKFMKM